MLQFIFVKIQSFISIIIFIFNTFFIILHILIQNFFFHSRFYYSNFINALLQFYIFVKLIFCIIQILQLFYSLFHLPQKFKNDFSINLILINYIIIEDYLTFNLNSFFLNPLFSKALLTLPFYFLNQSSINLSYFFIHLVI